MRAPSTARGDRFLPDAGVTQSRADLCPPDGVMKRALYTRCPADRNPRPSVGALQGSRSPRPAGSEAAAARARRRVARGGGTPRNLYPGQPSVRAGQHRDETAGARAVSTAATSTPAASGTTGGPGSTEPYRRRRYWPVLTVVAVLLVGAGIVWFLALKPAPELGRACNAPGPAPATTAPTSRSPTATAEPTASTGADGQPVSPTASPPPSTPQSINTSLGAFVDPATLAGVRPANPATVGLQVFNASAVRGQAKAVTDELRTAGFESIRAGTNDPLYPASDLRCIAEIRYGQAGAAAARTVLIMAPCAQLVVDDRIDDSVDLALGARYQYVPTSPQVKAELAALREAATPPAVIEGQTAAARPLPPIPPLPQANCLT